MGAPVGSEVRITYDAAPPGIVIEPGEALVTGTGRCYVILRAKKVHSSRWPNRWRLRCLVTEGAPPPGVLVHTLRWYTRGTVTRLRPHSTAVTFIYGR